MRLTTFCVPAFAALLCLPACGGGGATEAPVVPVGLAFAPEGVRHPHFPITPGTLWTYTGKDAEISVHEEVRALVEPRVILGTVCTPLEELTFHDGVLSGGATEWFAQDVNGNVWKFGEAAWHIEDGVRVPAPDSWMAGVGGARAWMFFPAFPSAGTRFAGYRPPDGTDVIEVRSISESATLPPNIFSDCVLVVENPDDPADSDIILYAPSVGRVQESNASGHMELVSVSRP